MTAEIKSRIETTDEGAFLVLPEEVLSHLQVAEGDDVQLVPTDDGALLMPGRGDEEAAGESEEAE